MFVVPVLVLASALLGAPVATAALTDDIATVVSDVGSVTEAPAKALPGLPVPVEVPELPPVRTPVPLPSVPKPPPPSTPPAPPATDAGEAQGLGDGAREVVTRAPSEAEGPGVLPAPKTRSEPGRTADIGIPGRGSVGASEMAPPRHWRTYVWPAIALHVGDALRPLLARFGGFTGVDLPDAFGLLAPSAVPASAGNDLPPERSGLLGQDLQSPPEAALPEEGMGLLATLLIGLLMAVGLVSLARLVVGEELFEAGHWPGHRG